MTTQKDELVKKTKEKIIELFGPESALAQAMEDDAFFDKLGDLVAYIYGLVMLSQPRPEPKYPQPRPEYPEWAKPWMHYKWGDHLSRTADGKWLAPLSTADSPFVHKLWSAMNRYEK